LPPTGAGRAPENLQAYEPASLQTPPSPTNNLGRPYNSLRGAQEATASPPPAQAPPGAAEDKLAVFMQAVQAKLDAGQLGEALLALSSLYDKPEVTELLDQLAGTVIYSRQHLLEPPYRVQPDETLEQIAQKYSVPWQLLARINGIRDPLRLEPGRELKVIRGPFDALVDLDKYEMTLVLGGRYAGRFPIGVGRDHARLEGSYVVRNKTTNPPYYGPDVDFAANDPNNPLGEHWIDLGNQIGIHGTNDPQNLHRTDGRGSVCLGARDIEDVFGILSIGSRVVIRR
jgi:lipoprotein-anchoring transpeptidase ErfK/SrfK